MSNWIKYIVLNKEKKWPIHWTSVKHSKSTGKCKVILLWDSISHLLERLPEWNKWQEMLTGIWKKRKLSSRLVRMSNCLVATMQIAMLSPQNIEINYHMTQLYPLLYIYPKYSTGMLAYLWPLLDHWDYLESRTNQDVHQQLKKKKMWSIFIFQFYAAIMTNTIITFVEKREATLDPYVKAKLRRKTPRDLCSLCMQKQYFKIDKYECLGNK